MGKVEEALRELVQYHAKRTAKEMLGDLPAQLRQARREVRQLHKELAALSRRLKEGRPARGGAAGATGAAAADAEQPAGARFSVRSLKSLRRRLDLTQKEMGKVLGVSLNTVNLWEVGKTRPRRAALARIVALRGASQKDVDVDLGRPSVRAPLKPDRISKLREKLGLRQSDLARQLGVSAATVAAWEKGRALPGRDKREMLEKMKRDGR